MKGNKKVRALALERISNDIALYEEEAEYFQIKLYKTNPDGLQLDEKELDELGLNEMKLDLLEQSEVELSEISDEYEYKHVKDMLKETVRTLRVLYEEREQYMD